MKEVKMYESHGEVFKDKLKAFDSDFTGIRNVIHFHYVNYMTSTACKIEGRIKGLEEVIGRFEDLQYKLKEYKREVGND